MAIPQANNFYAVLGVRSDASLAEIRAGYRAAALKYHPDKEGGSTELFQRIGAAYATLTDPDRKSFYDRELHSSTRETDAHDQMVCTEDAFLIFEKFCGQRAAPNATTMCCGTVVTITGLTKATHLNGKLAECEQWDVVKAKWNVRVLETGAVAAVASEKLVVAEKRPQTHGAQFDRGSVVTLSGLVSAPQFNGKLAELESWDASKSKWNVRLLETDKVIAVAPDKMLVEIGQPKKPEPPPPPPPPHSAPRPTRFTSQSHNVGQSCDPLPASKAEQLKSMIKCGIEREAALTAIGAVPGSVVRAQAETYLAYNFAPPAPPKAPPTNAKKLTVKNQKGKLLPIFQYPPDHANSRPSGRVYTFLVIGETGGGKTTLLDAFTNFLSGQKFQDSFRWKLVDENHMKDKPAGESQTSDVTYYYLWDERVTSRKCHVRIIDTPGFGDTKGVGTDEDIVKKFKALFESGEVPELDYVLWVVKSTESRLSTRQSYIHKCIQDIFGVDAADRFVMMCTFADGGEPQCLDVFSQSQTIKWQEYFKFNNSALYVDQSTPLAEFFWDLGNNSIDKFLQFVTATSILPMSCTLTQEVLQTRQVMQLRADDAAKRINRGIAKAEYLHRLLQDMKQHEGDMNSNKDYTFTDHVVVLKQVPLEPGDTAYQWCTNCNQLCCQYCKWPEGVVQSPCTYFNGGNNCPVCKKKGERACTRAQHSRQTHKDIQVKEAQTTTYEGKETAYLAAQQGLTSAQYALRQQVKKLEKVAKVLLADMDTLKQCRIRIDEIALSKVNHSNVNLFAQMIAEEEKTKSLGFQARIQALQLAKSRAETIEKMVGADSFEQLFPAYQEEINRVLQEQQKDMPRKQGRSNGRDMCSVM